MAKISSPFTTTTNPLFFAVVAISFLCVIGSSLLFTDVHAFPTITHIQSNPISGSGGTSELVNCRLNFAQDLMFCAAASTQYASKISTSPVSWLAASDFNSPADGNNGYFSSCVLDERRGRYRCVIDPKVAGAPINNRMVIVGIVISSFTREGNNIHDDPLIANGASIAFDNFNSYFIASNWNIGTNLIRVDANNMVNYNNISFPGGQPGTPASIHATSKYVLTCFIPFGTLAAYQLIAYNIRTGNFDTYQALDNGAIGAYQYNCWPNQFVNAGPNIIYGIFNAGNTASIAKLVLTGDGVISRTSLYMGTYTSSSVLGVGLTLYAGTLFFSRGTAVTPGFVAMVDVSGGSLTEIPTAYTDLNSHTPGYLRGAPVILSYTGMLLSPETGANVDSWSYSGLPRITPCSFPVSCTVSTVSVSDCAWIDQCTNMRDMVDVTLKNVTILPGLATRWTVPPVASIVNWNFTDIVLSGDCISDTTGFELIVSSPTTNSVNVIIDGMKFGQYSYCQDSDLFIKMFSTANKPINFNVTFKNFYFPSTGKRIRFNISMPTANGSRILFQDSVIYGGILINCTDIDVEFNNVTIHDTGYTSMTPLGLTVASQLRTQILAPNGQPASPNMNANFINCFFNLYWLILDSEQGAYKFDNSRVDISSSGDGYLFWRSTDNGVMPFTPMTTTTTTTTTTAAGTTTTTLPPCMGPNCGGFKPMQQNVLTTLNCQFNGVRLVATVRGNFNLVHHDMVWMDGWTRTAPIIRNHSIDEYNLNVEIRRGWFATSSATFLNNLDLWADENGMIDNTACQGMYLPDPNNQQNPVMNKQMNVNVFIEDSTIRRPSSMAMHNAIEVCFGCSGGGNDLSTVVCSNLNGQAQLRFARSEVLRVGFGSFRFTSARASLEIDNPKNVSTYIQTISSTSNPSYGSMWAQEFSLWTRNIDTMNYQNGPIFSCLYYSQTCLDFGLQVQNVRYSFSDVDRGFSFASPQSPGSPIRDKSFGAIPCGFETCTIDIETTNPNVDTPFNESEFYIYLPLNGNVTNTQFFLNLKNGGKLKNGNFYIGRNKAYPSGGSYQPETFGMFSVNIDGSGSELGEVNWNIARANYGGGVINVTNGGEVGPTSFIFNQSICDGILPFNPMNPNQYWKLYGSNNALFKLGRNDGFAGLFQDYTNCSGYQFTIDIQNSMIYTMWVYEADTMFYTMVDPASTLTAVPEKLIAIKINSCNISGQHPRFATFGNNDVVVRKGGIFYLVVENTRMDLYLPGTPVIAGFYMFTFVQNLQGGQNYITIRDSHVDWRSQDSDADYGLFGNYTNGLYAERRFITSGAAPNSLVLNGTYFKVSGANLTEFALVRATMSPWANTSAVSIIRNSEVNVSSECKVAQSRIHLTKFVSNSNFWAHNYKNGLSYNIDGSRVGLKGLQVQGFVMDPSVSISPESHNIDVNLNVQSSDIYLEGNHWLFPGAPVNDAAVTFWHVSQSLIGSKTNVVLNAAHIFMTGRHLQRMIFIEHVSLSNQSSLNVQISQGSSFTSDAYQVMQTMMFSTYPLYGNPGNRTGNVVLLVNDTVFNHTTHEFFPRPTSQGSVDEVSFQLMGTSLWAKIGPNVQENKWWPESNTVAGHSSFLSARYFSAPGNVIVVDGFVSNYRAPGGSFVSLGQDSDSVDTGVSTINISSVNIAATTSSIWATSQTSGESTNYPLLQLNSGFGHSINIHHVVYNTTTWSNNIAVMVQKSGGINLNAYELDFTMIGNKQEGNDSVVFPFVFVGLNGKDYPNNVKIGPYAKIYTHQQNASAAYILGAANGDCGGSTALQTKFQIQQSEITMSFDEINTKSGMFNLGTVSPIGGVCMNWPCDQQCFKWFFNNNKLKIIDNRPIAWLKSQTSSKFSASVYGGAVSANPGSISIDTNIMQIPQYFTFVHSAAGGGLGLSIGNNNLTFTGPSDAVTRIATCYNDAASTCPYYVYLQNNHFWNSYPFNDTIYANNLPVPGNLAGGSIDVLCNSYNAPDVFWAPSSLNYVSVNVDNSACATTTTTTTTGATTLPPPPPPATAIPGGQTLFMKNYSDSADCSGTPTVDTTVVVNSTCLKMYLNYKEIYSFVTGCNATHYTVNAWEGIGCEKGTLIWQNYLFAFKCYQYDPNMSPNASKFPYGCDLTTTTTTSFASTSTTDSSMTTSTTTSTTTMLTATGTTNTTKTSSTTTTVATAPPPTTTKAPITPAPTNFTVPATKPPAVVEAQKIQEDTTSAVTAVGASAGLFGLSSPTLATVAARAGMISKLASCEPSLDEELPRYVSPLGWEIDMGAPRVHYHMGAVIGNAGIFAGFTLLSFLYAAIHSAIFGKPEERRIFGVTYRSLGAGRFPGSSVFFLLFFSQPFIGSSLTAIFYGNTLTACICIFVILITLGCGIFLWIALRNDKEFLSTYRTREQVEFDRKIAEYERAKKGILEKSPSMIAEEEAGACERFDKWYEAKIEGVYGEWYDIPRPDEKLDFATRDKIDLARLKNHEGHKYFILRFGNAFDMYKSKFRYFVCMEFLASIILGICDGLVEMMGCDNVAYLLVALFALYVVAVLFIQPYACRKDMLFGGIISLLQLIGGIFTVLPEGTIGGEGAQEEIVIFVCSSALFLALVQAAEGLIVNGLRFVAEKLSPAEEAPINYNLVDASPVVLRDHTQKFDEQQQPPVEVPLMIKTSNAAADTNNNNNNNTGSILQVPQQPADLPLSARSKGREHYETQQHQQDEEMSSVVRPQQPLVPTTTNSGSTFAQHQVVQPQDKYSNMKEIDEDL